MLLPLQLEYKCLDIIIVRGKSLGVGWSEIAGGEDKYAYRQGIS